jgi:hypothetical protein
MSSEKERASPKEKIYPPIVAKVIDSFRIVINIGRQGNIKQGQRFLIYELTNEEIRDPMTGESLGKLEVVKGTGKVIHVQEMISTVESDMRETPSRTIIRRPSAWLGIEEETIQSPSDLRPFHEPKVGDIAKPIS